MNDQTPPARRKPARKRALVSKPYQDQILTMAQARNEVVADLRLHWATRRQQARINNQPGPVSEISWRNPRVYASSTGLISRPVSSFGQPEMLNFATPAQTIAPETSFYQSTDGLSTSCSPTEGTIPCVDRSPAAGTMPDESSFGVSAERAGLLEIGPCDDFALFGEVVEFPAWMNANVDGLWGGDSFGDAALPCMDLEGIEGMDGEWLV